MPIITKTEHLDPHQNIWVNTMVNNSPDSLARVRRFRSAEAPIRLSESRGARTRYARHPIDDRDAQRRNEINVSIRSIEWIDVGGDDDDDDEDDAHTQDSG